MKKHLLSTITTLAISGVLIAQVPCSKIFFSEYVEGTGNNKALEIYNPTNQPVNLNNYKMARYRNGSTFGDYVSFPTGTIIPPKNVLVVVLDKRNPNGTGTDTMVDPELQALAHIFLCPVYNLNSMMYFNGNDAVTIEEIASGAILDIIGVIGQDPGYGWNDDENNLFQQSNWYDPNHWTYNNTMIRKPSVTHGVNANPAFFNPAIEWDTIGVNVFTNLRTHNCECGFNNVEEPLETSPTVLLYPNPTQSGYVTVHSSKIIKKIEIYNTIGQLVSTVDADGSTAKITIDTHNLNKGLYLVKILHTNQTKSTRKLKVE